MSWPIEVLDENAILVSFVRMFEEFILTIATEYDNDLFLQLTFRKYRTMDRLDRLRLFVEIAETGSFSAVARTRTVSASTVTLA